VLTSRRPLTLVVLFVAMATVAGCGEKPQQSSAAPRRSAQAHQLKKSDMSVAEQKYGIAPIPDSTVT